MPGVSNVTLWLRSRSESSLAKLRIGLQGPKIAKSCEILGKNEESRELCLPAYFVNSCGGLIPQLNFSSPNATLFVTMLSFCRASKTIDSMDLRSSRPVRSQSRINEFEPFYGIAFHSHPRIGYRTAELTEKLQTEIFYAFEDIESRYICR